MGLSWMVVSLRLTVVLYSYSGNAARHGSPKKERTMGLRDVTLFVVTELPYPGWCL